MKSGGKQSELRFATYLRHIWSDHWPGESNHYDPCVVGQSHMATIPMLALFMTAVTWYLTGSQTVPWLRLVVITALGVPAGLLIGYWHAKIMNRALPCNKIVRKVEHLTTDDLPIATNWTRSNILAPNAPRRLNFITFLRHVFSDDWLFPPRGLAPNAVGQTFAVTLPMLTSFIALSAWYLTVGSMAWRTLLAFVTLAVPMGLILGY